MINYILQVTPFAETPEILIFAILLGGFLMTASRIWKARIFSVMSVGVWLYLMFELAEETSIVIVMIALMAEELYHAFIARAGE